MLPGIEQKILAGAAALLAVTILSYSAYAVQQPAQSEPAGVTAGIQPSVIVLDQKSDGQNIKLTYVYVPQKSFVVIYGSDANGKPSGDPLGTMAIGAGDHRDVKLTLATAVKSGSKLWVSLNQDKAESKSGFDKTSDVSYWSSSDMPLANSFKVL
jgi:hypothetical protein